MLDYVRQPRRLRMIMPRLITLIALIVHGWRPGRKVFSRLRLPRSFTIFTEARRILNEFGGLKFGTRNSYTLFDPSSADEAVDEIKNYELLINRPLYPLGFRDHQDREYLLVDDAGIVYLLTGGILKGYAPTFDRALERIVWTVEKSSEVKDDLRTVGMETTEWHLDPSDSL